MILFNSFICFSKEDKEFSNSFLLLKIISDHIWTSDKAIRVVSFKPEAPNARKSSGIELIKQNAVKCGRWLV